MYEPEEIVLRKYSLKRGRWTEWAKLIELTLQQWPKNVGIKTVKHDENNVIHSSLDGLTITWLATMHSMGNAIAFKHYEVHI